MQTIVASNNVDIHVGSSVEGIGPNPGIYPSRISSVYLIYSAPAESFPGAPKCLEITQNLPDVLPQLTSHLGNITSLLSNALISVGLAQPDIGRGILVLNHLSQQKLKDQSSLLRYLPSIIESSHDEHLKWTYIMNCVRATPIRSPKDVEDLATQGVQYFAQCNDYTNQGMPR
jgi:hypothetical protein